MTDLALNVSAASRVEAERKRSAVRAQLASLPELPMADIWALWDQYFEKRPHTHHRDYVTAKLAYAIQARAFGGLSPATRRKLEKIGETGVIPGRQRSAEAALAPGTMLLRHYDGVEHRVTVLPDGNFEWNGAHYRSLSAVARAITGSQWNGLVFFGLKKVNRKEAR